MTPPATRSASTSSSRPASRSSRRTSREVLKHAVVAAEDRSFYSHGGVDLRGTLRALWPTSAAARRRRAARRSPSSTWERLHRRRAHDRPQDPRGDPRQPARPAGRQGHDPLPVPVDHLLRRGRLRRRRRGADVLPQAGARAHAVGGGVLAGVIPAPSRTARATTSRPPRPSASIVLDAMLEEALITPASTPARLRQALRLAAHRPPTGTAPLVHPAEGAAVEQPWFTDYVRPVARGRTSPAASTVLPRRPHDRHDARPVRSRRRPRGGRRVPRGHRARPAHVARRRSSRRPATCGPWSGAATRDRPVNHALGARRRRLRPPDRARASSRSSSPGRSRRASARTTTYSGRPHDVTEPCGPKPDGSPTVLENYGARLRHADPAQRHPTSVNTVFTRLIQDVGVKETMDLARSMGLTTVRAYDADGSTARRSPSAPSRCRRSRWRRPTACSPTTGERAEPTPVLRVIDRDGKVLIDNTEPETDAGARRGRRRQRHRRAAGRPHQRHRRGPRARPARRRQDRHRPRTTRTPGSSATRPTLSTAVWMGYGTRLRRPAKTCAEHRSTAARRSPAARSRPGSGRRSWRALATSRSPSSASRRRSRRCPTPRRSARGAASSPARGCTRGGRRRGSYVEDVPPPEADPPDDHDRPPTTEHHLDDASATPTDHHRGATTAIRATDARRTRALSRVDRRRGR